MSEPDQRLQVIFETAKILVAEHDLGAMLPKLLPSLIDTLDAADTGSLWFYDAAEDQLKVEASCGYDEKYLKQMHLAPGEAIAGKVFQARRAQLYPTAEATAEAMADLSPENRYLFARATVGLQQPLSAMGVPLSKGETCIGVLSLLNLRQPASFGESDLDFVQRVADLISIAVDNARLREELEAAQALSEANRLKAEVIGILAHEMRTPLTSIKGYSTALLMEEITFRPETQREFLQFIDEECDVLQTLIHDLLESSIIDAGLLRLEPQPVKLPPLVKNVLDDMARRTQMHHFLVDIPEHFPILDADPDRIVQVLRNLLDNAVKYSPEGGLIVVRGEVRRDEVVVSVADQGVGLTPEQLNRLFEKFYRAKSPLGRHVVGSGLGLPISRTIVESHGGRIWAESQLGEGTTFYFTLPLEGLGQEPAEPQERQHG